MPGAGRPARGRWPTARLHATLHFIGGFRPDRIADLGRALDAVAIEPMRLSVQGDEMFHGGIAVALLAADPALLALQAGSARRSPASASTLDARPYRPHVTLARKAAGARRPAPLPPVEWRANGFALVRSRGGALRRARALGRRRWLTRRRPCGGRLHLACAMPSGRRKMPLASARQDQPFEETR